MAYQGGNCQAGGSPNSAGSYAGTFSCERLLSRENEVTSSMHSIRKWFPIFVIGVKVALPAIAGPTTLYKSVLPNGRTVYSDEPVQKAKRSQKITVDSSPVSPQQTADALRALSLTRAQLLRDASAKDARLKQLDNEITDAYSGLKDASTRRLQSREVGEGDRQGRRLVAPYFERQRKLDLEEQQARVRLDRLIAERAVLQP